MDNLEHLERVALARIETITNKQTWQEIRSEILGKKGVLGAALRSLGDLSASERPRFGEQLNSVKQRLEAAFDRVSEQLESRARDSAREAGRFDVTLPGRRVSLGAPHPLRLVEEEIIACLMSLGFVLGRGPLVEHDWYNFESLNFPPEHPARDMQDTFFITPQVLLRTHTSNVQIRTMSSQKPPVRVIAPGMVFRRDDVDPTHSPVFHQVEGLWVDKFATFADLKGVLRRLIAHLFGAGLGANHRRRTQHTLATAVAAKYALF